MGIAHFRDLIIAWLSGLTLVGLAQTVKWFYEVRKLHTETAQIRKQLADTEHRQRVERLAAVLVRRAECLDPNANWLTKAQWAGLLNHDAKLIDEVFATLQGDDLLESSGTGIWKIGYKTTLARKRG